MSTSLETFVAGVRLETCVYNASGPRTGSSAALAKIATSEAGAILAKSATIEKQTGNPQPRVWHDTETNGASLNSEGLPNSGIEYYIDAKTVKESLAGTDKPYMVSISGHTLKDNLKMMDMIIEARHNGVGIAAVELNLACPNVIGKPIIAYDFDQLDQVLKQVCATFQKKRTLLALGIKMPPYLDGPHFQQAASIINKYKEFVGYVATINTIGNALAIDVISESPCIRAKGGFAGLSGKACKYTALANVKQLRQLLDKSIDVVGVGGIASGKDAFEMLLCGASAVQVGTCHWNEGPTCFDRICRELRELMQSKGYASVEKDVIGKLKPWTKEGAAQSRAARKEKEQLLHKSATSEPAGKMDVFMLTSALLLVAVAVLLGDKFGALQI